MGNLICKAFSAVSVVGKIEPELSDFKFFSFFFRQLKSVTAINMCLDQMGYAKRKRYSICESLADKKKVFKNWTVFLKVCMKSREC